MAAASSFFGIRDEDHTQMKQHTSSNPPTAMPAGSTQTAVAPVKKKRNLPGTPNPDAEVIALSPKTLMATNRFICEVCNKGFQREQNLQLHRRGHNLPWKLRQKSTKEVRRRVYLCPEPTCIHHDPSRALGDLTGVKKHFSRKHGEKKWKCDKCSKRYAVQSDWKAHSKTCGTREYRCDCGTLFSRRDSFITHRAFCDALAQESARLPTSLTALGSHLFGSNNNNTMGLGLPQVSSTHLSSLQQPDHPSTDLLRLGGGGPTGPAQFDHLLSPPSNPSSASFRPPISSPYFLSAATAGPTSSTNQDFNDLHHSKPFHGGLLQQLPDLHNNTTSSSAVAANLFNLSFFANGSNNNPTNNNNNNNNNNSNNAAEIFSTSNNDHTALFAGTHLMNDRHFGSGVSSLYNESVLPQMSATALLQKAAQMGATTSRGYGRAHQMENNETQLQDLMNSLANGSTAGIFGGGGLCNIDEAAKFQDGGLTRDFLGVGSIVRGMGAGMTSSQREHGIDHMGSLDSTSSASARSFAGGSMQ